MNNIVLRFIKHFLKYILIKVINVKIKLNICIFIFKK